MWIKWTQFYEKQLNIIIASGKVSSLATNAMWQGMQMCAPGMSWCVGTLAVPNPALQP